MATLQVSSVVAARGVAVHVAAFLACLAVAEPQPMWAPKGLADEPDCFVGFRGVFSTTNAGASLRIVGASEYLVWLDGKLIHDGPARFARAFPEYQTVPLETPAGQHVLAVQVRNCGVTTRILSDIPPFLWADVRAAEASVPVKWTCARLPGQKARAGRISDILGWTDWVDTRQSWPGWQLAGYDARDWLEPVAADPGIGAIKPCTTGPVGIRPRAIRAVASGGWAATLGYEADEPAARFFLDDLTPKGVPPQGVWRRYDLGRVQLGRASITLECPAGAVVEIATSEQLVRGRVSPWITLSGSRTCNMDHFVARGGLQTFMPFTPKGGRYLEVHVKSPAPVRFVKEEFLERSSFGEPAGAFACDDKLLNQIWQTGVDTVRACADDALVDCPTRERGEWTGDVASVATDIAAVAFGDLSLSRRALVQAAQSARADGLVAGVGPGDPGYLSTYAAQWVTACVHYWELSGDRTILTELHDAARRNLEAFAKHTHASGLDGDLGWGFVDWGYAGNDGPSDMALNLHFIEALQAMLRWDKALGQPQERDKESLRQMSSAVSSWIGARTSQPGGWDNVGYHCAVLALHAGLVAEKDIKPCVTRIKRHLIACFPNNPTGPRLSDPGVQEPMVITPYFGHWAMAALMEHGEADFVLDQYRKCWGWALKDGDTTWLEVFDTRWSHCHEWSGCPTWQLSRYVLGLRVRFDLGPDTIEFNPTASKLSRASGSLPLPGGRILHVEWHQSGDRVDVTFSNGLGQQAQLQTRFGQTVKVPKAVLANSSGR